MFVYSYNPNIKCEHWKIFLDVLENNEKWIYKLYNKENMYDLVNSVHNSIYSNQSIINNFLGNCIFNITSKYDFHKNFEGFKFIPETYLIYNNINEVINKIDKINNFNDIYLLKK